SSTPGWPRPTSSCTNTDPCSRPYPHTDGGWRSLTHVADSHDLIRVPGARENNLDNIEVEIPKRRLTVFTGVSGSGKSSLVFDTNALLRVLFSRLGEPYVGPPGAFSFNTASIEASGMVSTGGGKAEKTTFTRAGGMCPHCEGRGVV